MEGLGLDSSNGRPGNSGRADMKDVRKMGIRDVRKADIRNVRMAGIRNVKKVGRRVIHLHDSPIKVFDDPLCLSNYVYFRL